MPGTGSAPPGSPAVGSPTPVAVDPDLLGFVPQAGDGVALTFDRTTSTTVAADPGLAQDAAALAIGLYTRTPASPGDLVVVSVVRLRDPAADETWFRDWRDTYDTAACANASGVVRHAETVLGGRTFYIGSCAGGSFTYHVRLPDEGVVVSLTSIGAGRLGEEIVQRMAP